MGWIVILFHTEIVGLIEKSGKNDDYLNTRTATVVSSEASEIQNEVERILLPLTVDWR